MGWSPAPLDITDFSIDRAGTKWTVTIHSGDQFKGNLDAFLVDSAARAVDFLTCVVHGKDAPRQGILRAVDVTAESLALLICHFDTTGARSGKYRLVLDRVAEGMLEVAMSDESTLIQI